MTNNQIVKETCKNTIENQFKGRFIVKCNEELQGLHGTNKKFDVICYQKRYWRDPEGYMVFDFFDKISHKEIIYFKQKVRSVDEKIKSAFMCSGKAPDPLAYDELKSGNTLLPPAICLFPC